MKWPFQSPSIRFVLTSKANYAVIQLVGWKAIHYDIRKKESFPLLNHPFLYQTNLPTVLPSCLLFGFGVKRGKERSVNSRISKWRFPGGPWVALLSPESTHTGHSECNIQASQGEPCCPLSDFWPQPLFWPCKVLIWFCLLFSSIIIKIMLSR